MPDLQAPAVETLRRVAAGAVEADDLPRAMAAALRLARIPIALVLDNLHEIRSPQVHSSLIRLVQRPPPYLALLVTTRRDPPWPLTQLRLAGMVAEVRAADLAFRGEEAAALFLQLGVGVTGAQLEQLVQRTEGWPAGLRLAAMHLKGVADVAAAVEAFSGEDHSVAGYLLTEVLDRQSPELSPFWRRSASSISCVPISPMRSPDDRWCAGARRPRGVASVRASGGPAGALVSTPPTDRRHPADPAHIAPQATGPVTPRGGVVPQQRHAAGRHPFGGRRRTLATGRGPRRIHVFTLIMSGRGRALERLLARISTGGVGRAPGARGCARVGPRRAGIGRPGGEVDRPRSSSRRCRLRSPGRARGCVARPERVRGRPDRRRLGGDGGGVPFHAV